MGEVIETYRRYWRLAKAFHRGHPESLSNMRRLANGKGKAAEQARLFVRRHARKQEESG